MHQNILKDHLKKISISQEQLSELNGLFLTSELNSEVSRNKLFSKALDTFKIGKYQISLILLELGLKLFPTDASFMNLRGICLRNLKMFKESIAQFEAAIKRYPTNSILLNSLGNAYIDLKEYDKALVHLEKATELEPEYALALSNLGICHRETGVPSKAILYFKKAIKIDPKFANAFHHLAKTYYDIFDLRKAETFWKECLKLNPRHMHALQNLAILRLEHGDTKSAKLLAHKALTIEPNNPKFLRIFSLVHKFGEHEDIFKNVVNLNFNNISDPIDRVELLFAQGKAYEDIGKFDNAWEAFKLGGALKKKTYGYQIQSDLNTFNILLKFNRSLVNSPITHIKSSNTAAHTPIFICGMPRSGTTLLERILSSHHDITPLGELEVLSKLAAKIIKGKDKKLNITEIGDRYLHSVTSIRDISTGYFTDKMPHNFLFIPLILKCLPHAKILHIKRDKLATVWSNFRTFFIGDRLGYSNDISDTILYYNLYEKYIEKCLSLFPNSVIDVDYETLSSQPMSEIPRILNDLNIPFDSACLKPEESRYSSSTASQAQVNQKIYAGSSNAWKKYEKFLLPIYDDTLSKFSVN